ncbi:MAG: dynamin, partial [Anaerolineaceae bacterium]|nr:dynamin [Anaerolineaceae bacterium]
AQTAVAATAAITVSAVGLGALVTALATTVAADVTGILLASLVVVLGLFVIPTRKRNAKKDLSDKIALLREKLVTALTQQFQHEIDRSLERIRTAISPYSRFVRVEVEKLNETQSELKKLQTNLADLKVKVENI